MKSIICFTIFLAVSAADVKKVDDVLGTVRSLETDSTGTSYAVAEYENSDHLYVLDPVNNVIFTSEFGRIASVILNIQEELYIIDYRIDNNTMKIYTYDKSTSEIIFIVDFTPHQYWGFFFDNDDNLFFNSIDGISILPKNKQDIVTVSNLESDYHISTNYSHAVDQNGNVYIGVVIKDSLQYQSKAIIIEKDEINKPNPTTYFINVDPEGLYNMAAFRDSIFIGTSKYLIEITNGDQSSPASGDFGLSDDFVVFKNRFYYKYISSLKCLLKFITPDGKIHDTTGCTIANCHNLHQTMDGSGNVFLGERASKSDLYVLRNDDTACKALSVPDDLNLYGHIVATKSGDLWVLSSKTTDYSLFVVPSGGTAAVLVQSLPQVKLVWFMKAKLNADEVLVGTDDGLYVATY